MKKNDIKGAAMTMKDSLNSTQTNATNTQHLVQQVISMSAKKSHEQTVQTILNDKTLSMEEKINLIHRERASYNCMLENNTNRVTRLQDKQAKNTDKATGVWGEAWRWIVFGGVVAIALFTPQGGKAITSARHQFAA